MARCLQTGKRIYPSKHDAEDERKRQAVTTLATLRVYVCEFCGAYHLTHKKPYTNF